MLENRCDAAGHFHRIGGELHHARMRIAADDAKARGGNRCADCRPDLAAEIVDGVDVSFPIHRAEKHHQWLSRGRTRGCAIPVDVHTGGDDTDS